MENIDQKLLSYGTEKGSAFFKKSGNRHPKIIETYGKRLVLFMVGLLLVAYQQAMAQSSITWTDVVGLSVDGNILGKKTGTNGWNAGAASTQSIPAGQDGWVEMTILETNTHRMFGLSTTNGGPGWGTIGYAVYTNTNSSLSVYESGSYKGHLNTYMSGDVIRVERVNGTIYYKKNGVTFLTSTSPSSGSLIADVSIHSVGGTISDAKIFAGIIPPPGDNLGNHTATTHLNMTNHRITNLANPISPQDAVNKAYIDDIKVLGDVNGPPSSTTVIGLQGRKISDVAPSSGQVLKWNGISWTPGTDNTGSGSSSVWNISGNDIYYTSGNVGIGTSSPTQRLDVSGVVKATSFQGNGSALSSLNATNISSGTLSASRVQYGNYFINSAGNSGQVWTSDGNGAGHWTTLSGGGPGDNLGNHIAIQNIRLNSKWLSGDGGDEGVFVNNTGNVGIGTSSPTQRLDVSGVVKASSFQGNGSALSSLNATNISSGTLSASRVQYGNYFINSAGNSGQVWTSDGNGAGHWTTLSGGGPGDNLGDHIAIQNIRLNSHWLSGDGGNEGLQIDNNGKVRVGVNGSADISLDLDLDGAIKLGEGYFSAKSETGADFAIMGTRAWYGNGQWNFSGGSGSAIQFRNNEVRFYTHNGTTSSFSETLMIDNNGNMGIGVTPSEKLDVNGTVKANSFVGDGSQLTGIQSTSPWNDMSGGIYYTGGNVAIGTTDPKGYKLAVAGDMIAESVRVKLQSQWPDYVFEKDYDLKGLEAVEAFIKENKHLPGIPSAIEVAKAGIDVGEMNAKLVEKVEELTLYAIQQERKIEKLEKESKTLQVLSEKFMELQTEIKELKNVKNNEKDN